MDIVYCCNQAEDEVVGNRVRVEVVKNKVAAPFREAEFDVMFGEGISRTGDVLDLAVSNEIVSKTGAWFSYKEQRLDKDEKSKAFSRKTRRHSSDS